MNADQTVDGSMRELTPLLIDVQSSLDQALSLRSMAQRFGCSPFHFHRYFSKTVGETPKQHVDRLRLERAAYKLAITAERVLDIALSVGFKNHETFSRAFKRAFGYSPRDYRRACRGAQIERLERNRDFRGEGCALSAVQFTSLPAASFLAIRRHGAYSELPVPFKPGDSLWNVLVDVAVRQRIPHQPLAVLICYDDPTVTPAAQQRADACIAIDGPAKSEGDVRRLEFAGGRYGGIRHAGPLETIDQAYYNLADGIRRSARHVFDVGPPVQIYREVHLGGDTSANISEVYFPVRAAP
jgi:AraC family transcriptional regulator